MQPLKSSINRREVAKGVCYGVLIGFAVFYAAISIPGVGWFIQDLFGG